MASDKGPRDARDIGLGIIVSIAVAYGTITAVMATLRGTMRDVYAIGLIREVDTLGPRRVGEWLCNTEVGGRFRITARDILASRGIDSSMFCERRYAGKD